MKARSLALAIFALAFGFGFAATSSVQAASNHRHSGNNGSQAHVSSGQSVAKSNKKTKHTSTKREPETKDYLTVTLTDASVMEFDTRKTPPMRHRIQASPLRRAH
jgi:hypothetical protein